MYGVSAGHERAPAGGADGVHVVVVEDDPRVGQAVYNIQDVQITKTIKIKSFPFSV